MVTETGGVLLGARIRQRRKELKLEQLDAARCLGVEQGTVSRWEDGRVPKRQYWPVLADFLGTTETEIGLIVGGGLRPTPDQNARLDRLEQRFDHLEAQVAALLDRLAGE